jgi:hypothetical protein
MFDPILQEEVPNYVEQPPQSEAATEDNQRKIIGFAHRFPRAI